jgi:hypothetical protein
MKLCILFTFLTSFTITRYAGSSRAQSLQSHLQKNHGIQCRITGKIIFFTYMGVNINAIAGTAGDLASTIKKDKQIQQIIANYPRYKKMGDDLLI